SAARPAGAPAARAAGGPAAPCAGETVDGPSVEDLAWIETWRAVYDHAHTGTDRPAVGADFTGWNSSYDGTPIPVDEMREWRDATVARIREYRPRRVLEIGVGSGALLVPLAEHCEHYTGTDLSSVALDALDRDLREQRPALHRRVELRAQPGHVTDGLRTGGYDLIILNSVVQYFPSRDYLTEVLDVALGLLTPGGHIFVGDVRNLRLHDHLRAAVRQHAPSAAAVAGAEETELLVDPALWDSLARDRPQIVGVDLRVKRGRAHNELTRYRYDVVLSTAPAPAEAEAEVPAEVRSVMAIPAVAWGSQLTSLDQLSRFMATDVPAPLRVTGVPNRRLHSGPRADAAPDPEQFHVLAARHGMWAALTWSNEDAELLDVVLLPATTRPPLTGLLTRTGRDDDLTYRPLTNSPAARTVSTSGNDRRDLAPPGKGR
ncbi:class I SAM-dependent methyltransferase, partial [Frankia sp. AiPs1]|uniref:class I SAM-dependent methyltransferase n=1 Tax=Frankia sp. AiPs1 TaxID=573493 RepID=UPI00204487BF